MPLALLLLLLAMLGGCAIGVNFEHAPTPPPPGPTTALRDVLVVYDVCPARPGFMAASKAAPAPWVHEFPHVLRRDFGIASLREWPPTEPRVVYVRVRLPALTTPTGLGLISGVLSTLTFSIIPGGYVEVHPVEFDVYAASAQGAVREETFRYEYRLTYVIWLPLVVYPDFVLPVYNSQALARRQLDPIIQRFMHDLDARLTAEGATGLPPSASAELAGCPAEGKGGAGKGAG
ncbi:MAG TPA: hypothetical protein VKB51_12820 [bacterium]|nr:hypothetical protein [bacterium]